MTIHIHQDDLPSHLDLGDVVAIDTETMGLNPLRDRLCLVQLSSGDSEAHLVKINSPMKPCPNLTGLLNDTNVTKLFHFARFDISSLSHNITPVKGPFYCTKIASKLSRTFGARHGLADLCKDLLGFELDKQNQTSDWGSKDLNASQLKYAASDVLHLHKIKIELDSLLKREEKVDIARLCFEFIKTRSKLDLIGFESLDIFSH